MLKNVSTNSHQRPLVDRKCFLPFPTSVTSQGSLWKRLNLGGQARLILFLSISVSPRTSRGKCRRKKAVKCRHWFKSAVQLRKIRRTWCRRFYYAAHVWGATIRKLAWMGENSNVALTKKIRMDDISFTSLCFLLLLAIPNHTRNHFRNTRKYVDENAATNKISLTPVYVMVSLIANHSTLKRSTEPH